MYIYSKSLACTFLLVCYVIVINACQEQTDLLSEADLVSERTRTVQRTAFRQNMVQNTIEASLRMPLSDSTEGKWQGAFWAMGLIRYTSDNTEKAIRTGLSDFDNRSSLFQRALLEIIYAVYPDRFIDLVFQIARRTEVPKIFAMSVMHLIRTDPGRRAEFTQLLQNKYPAWQANPILVMLHYDLIRKENMQPPPFKDLLWHNFPTRSPVVFSIQRPDRRFPGLSLIRESDGRFVRNSDGSLFNVQQLALSNSNLPGYITNGNTPAGIFSIQGEAFSQNVFIAPAPTLLTVMPGEVTAATYFHDTELNERDWSVDMYRALLPDSWQDYQPIYQAFYAGMAGRAEIIAHGSTINPEFYRNEPFFPLTPSLGCLTALEKWNSVNGVCQYSGQLKLINMLKQNGDLNGFLIVAETPDIKKAVSIEELTSLINR